MAPPVDAATGRRRRFQHGLPAFPDREGVARPHPCLPQRQRYPTMHERGRSGTVLHIEGAESIDANFEILDVLYAAGLRSLGPVWSRPNAFGHGVPFLCPSSPNTGPGLTDLGKELVRQCNKLRLVIDLSHINERGFWDVAAISNAPLIATHSNAHALSPHSRNLTDKQLAAIRETGGLVGINFATSFLRSDGARDADAPIELVIEHLAYMLEHLGEDGVGFGL